VAITYRHDPAAGVLTREVRRGPGAADVQAVALTSCCLSCSVRSDLATALASLHWEQPEFVLVCPPPAMDPVPLASGVVDLEPSGDARVAAVLAVVRPADLRGDLFGTDLLAERELAVAETDRRSVGEVQARQLEVADVVVLAGPRSRFGDALLEHLVGSERLRLPTSALEAAAGGLVRRSSAALDRADLRLVAPSGAADAAGVWTLDLSTWKPFHPQRLLDSIERLGGGPLRGRGVFWLASRPGTRCAWDGAGGQLSVGGLDDWDCPPFTRLIITGTGRHAGRLRRAFDDALLTDRELARGLEYWLPVDGDGWETWLGPCLGGLYSDVDADR
jgi:G3E family GTPase